jgi:fructokinase
MEKKYFLGLDVGGTKVEGAIAHLNIAEHSINIFSKKKIASVSSQNFEDFIISLSGLITDLLNEAKISLKELSAIGIGLPGSLNPNTHIMMNGNTRYLIGHDILAALKKSLDFNLPIYAQNDANLFTLAEAWGGVGKKYNEDRQVPFEEQIAVGITLGTGVGGGLVIKSDIFNGAHGAALEIGHISLKLDGPECYCGQRGCSELYLSGTALNKISDSKEIFTKVLNNDEEATKVLKEYRKNLIHLLSILNNLFNPHYFVFGGGLSTQSILFKDLKKELESNIFLSPEFCPEIYINQLGDSSGLFGAMIYAQELLHS